MLYAQKHGVFRAYNDLAFDRFWRRELDPENVEAVAAVLVEAGAPAGFAAFLAGEGGAEHDRLRGEAEASGVFGVPTFAFDGELFWGGDRIGLLRERLDEKGVTPQRRATRRLGLGRLVERAVDALVQRLHLAALLVDALLDQPLGAAEGVGHGKLRVGEAVVGLRRVIDVDVDAARQGHDGCWRCKRPLVR